MRRLEIYFHSFQFDGYLQTVQSKSSDYYSAVRAEITELLNSHADLALDVGCGAGTTSEYLKKTGKVSVAHGIEFAEEAASVAETRLDLVTRFDLNSSNPLPIDENRYDLVLALDVLEHLINPWARIKELARVLKSNGILVVSVPNIRNFRVIFPLLFKGEFQYTESGILDSTHLRFFTFKSALELASSSGLVVERITQSGRKPGSMTYWANLLTLGLLSEFFDIQYLIRLKKP